MDAKERKRKRDQAYYQANREEKIDRAVRYQQDNRAQKNRNNKKWRDENPAKMSTAVRSWRARNPEMSMLYNARERAKKMGVLIDITVDDIVIPDVCPVFGFPLERGDGRKQDNSPSLDRIDNNLGYVRGNVVVVSWLANRIKSNASLDQLKAIVAFYEAQAQKAPPSSI